MKTKLTSVLLCVLLSTSLGHDYHRAKGLAHQNKRSHHLSHFHERASPSEEQCEWKCEGGGIIPGGPLELYVNVTVDVDLLAVVNETSQVALILDLKADLVGLFNGTSGAILIINITTGVGVYITHDQSDRGWLASQETFKIFFSSLTSLKVFLDLNVGTKFTASSASKAILEIITNLLAQLSVRIGLQIGGQIELSITILLDIASRLSSLLNGPLDGLLGLIGGLITLGGDLQWLVEVLEGLSLLLSEIPGGLSTLLRAKVNLDIALLLGATDGIELLVNFLLAVVTRIDLSCLSNILNNLETLLSVLVKLGGNSSGGINGILKVLSGIVSLLEGHLIIDELISGLLEFAASRSTDIDLSLSLEELESVIHIQGSLHSSSNATLSGFITIVESLRNGTLIVDKINISAIINILVEGASDGIELIVRVLLSLSEVVKPVVSIPTLLLNLISGLNVTWGVHLVESLVPGVSINVTVSGGIDWKATLKGVNISTIIHYIATGDIKGLLTSLPVISDIAAAIDKAVKSASNGALSLEKLLEGAGSIVWKIIVWIGGSLGLSGHIDGGGHATITLKPITKFWTLKPIHIGFP